MPYIASNNGQRIIWKEAGYKVQAGEQDMGVTFPTEAELAAAFPGFSSNSLISSQSNANLRIDAEAGVVREKYITSVPGQSDTYIKKAIDAANYKAAGYPFASLASYPWVQAEAVARYGATPTSAQAQAAADLILATEAAWIAKGAAIEQQRIAIKVQIAAAATIADVQIFLQSGIAALQAM